MTDARFEACLPFILKEEGGNDDDPQDHGGRTSRGITQREYTAWRKKKGLPDKDVWTASGVEEIWDIYYEEYWLPRGPKLHPGVDLVWFNFAVNAGPGEAYKLLLRSIGPDGVDNDVQTINRMCDAGETFYQGLAQFPRYGNGWTARTARIRAAALKMKQEVPVATSAPWPPPKPMPPAVAPAPPMIGMTKGHVMIDITQVENEVNIGLSMAQNMMPFLGLILPPQVVALLTAAIAGARTIEANLNIPTSAAIVAATAHVTPGAPNAAALSP